MSSFGCCLWWFLAGALLGWLLHHLLTRCCCKPGTCETKNEPPIAKAADIPVSTVTSAPVSAPVAATTPAVVAKPKPVKPKATAKPKTAAKPKAEKPKAATFDIASAKAAGFTIKNADDLTVIEGIGPKISELFKDNGLKTFAQVAKATEPQMRAILDKGGARFRMANPGTWAQQAALAADNKWTELKALQDKLNAGVNK